MEKITLNYKSKNSGHYSPGIIHNGLLYISGQLSLNPETRTKAEGGLAAETRQALTNLDRCPESSKHKKRQCYFL